MIMAFLNFAVAHLASFVMLTIDGAPDSGAGWLLLIGPLGGGALYFWGFRYYRNTHRSHGYEHETRIEAQPVTGDDEKVREIKGTRQPYIDGDNRSNHRKRVQRG